ncbi:DUF2489 domain-containing protein [Aliidiomarina minuta]|uniref:DUF2489 domain-containing protein n=1 Tax=Aliidiomarina minuta TaxID=880057 RepID=A0A432W9W7_9GAMM|nr:DUF2489 domain-containing protein [Aliidiomarina minuta]RUO26943.1 DUF2489 domain-containing protein [Aliidiomarina minuta]
MLWIAFIAGLLIIAGLSFYAGSLLAKLRKQRQVRDTAVAKRNANLLESIETIALAMQQEQCPLSEGSLRVTVLLDHLALREKYDFAQQYPAIHDMYERIKHMPTHEARKQYPRKEIRKMDDEREGYEKDLAENIQTDVAELLVWVKKERA